MSKYIDVQLLIREVEKHPIIWDTTFEFRNKRNIRDAWIEICTGLVENFKNKDEVQKNTMVQDLSLKWRYLRDNYIRNLRQRLRYHGPKRKKEYIYARQLHFLRKNKLLQVLIDNVEKKKFQQEANEANQSSEETDETLTKSKRVLLKDPSPPSPPEIIIPKTDFQQIDSPRSDNPQIESPSTDYHQQIASPRTDHHQQIASPRTDHHQQIASSRTDHHQQIASPRTHFPRSGMFTTSITPNNILEEDHDMAFFYSVLPMVRKLNMDQKFTFRLQTMQILQNIRNTTESWEANNTVW